MTHRKVLEFKITGRNSSISFGGPNREAELLAHQRVEEFLIQYPNITFSMGDEIPKKVWVYWAQGEEQAPDIVKRCLFSIRKRNQDREVMLLDSGNYHKYVHIDPVIVSRFTNNKTHFSDVLRVNLLAKHGGAWLDATCFCAKSVTTLIHEMSLPHLTESFTRSGFFAYTAGNFMSNWCLVSAADNIIVNYLSKYLNWYWTNYDELPHYFWFHLAFQAFCRLDRNFQSAWERSLRLSSSKAHLLQKALGREYNKEQFFDIYHQSHLHKLTYKYTPSNSDVFTYWDYLNDLDQAF